MNWLYYLLEANLYLAAFYFMYKLLLQRSTFYSNNRYFLIWSIIVAFAIPLVQLNFLKPQLVLEIEAVPYEISLEATKNVTVAQTTSFTLQDYLFYAYIAIAILLGFKLVISISKIIGIFRNGNKIKLDKYTLVELTSEHTAFSFFNILFIHPEMAKNNAVLRHEMIHINQKHSWDIVLLETLKICCWFNPLVYLMKKDLTLLHEYIADEQTTAKNISKHEYAMFLIENSMAAYSSSLVNQLFNQSILKSRINMLNKEKTANWARLKYLLAVPLGLGLLCASTLGFSKSYGYLEIGKQKTVQKTVQKNKQEKPMYYPEHRYDNKNNFISLEKRAIIINGKLVTDKNKFYGIVDAEEVKYLNSAEATKIYGSKIGKNGAVVINGKDIAATPPPPMSPSPTPKSAPEIKKDQVKFPPPRIQSNNKDQVKFPPPVVKPRNQKSFYPANTYYNKKAIKVDSRLIVINGEVITDNSTFYGVTNTESVVFVNPKHAEEKYGTKARYGAVEITGRNLNRLPLVEPPPIEPPPADKKVKRPPTPPLNPQKPSGDGVKLRSSEQGESLASAPSEKQATRLDRSKKQYFSVVGGAKEIKTLKVYDRWGREVYVNENYNNDWDGHEGNTNDFKSRELPTGTYFYLTNSKNDNVAKQGWVYIK
ncbi:gliding motility-associated C-terminal domain-containing protein [Nubsella zeaxanthinifaciens]|uniref:T9SS type B sorting domain-containing protein n=1 Tax=Nubsella zeaxanthinifaciens TaxID=392412 RepID=UPI000DE2A191|nr:gliding motility-associated C-terminal domain-containing protein [Nubsella zeaxanthinifaciens]